MKDTTVKLLFAGLIGMLALIAALSVVITGMVLGMSTEAIIALAAVFSTPGIASITFFFGHTNGKKDALNGQTS